MMYQLTTGHVKTKTNQSSGKQNSPFARRHTHTVCVPGPNISRMIRFPRTEKRPVPPPAPDRLFRARTPIRLLSLFSFPFRSSPHLAPSHPVPDRLTSSCQDGADLHHDQARRRAEGPGNQPALLFFFFFLFFSEDFWDFFF
jgi:hypothetical protein